MIMPAGYYYIGDPCYVVRNEDWGDFVDATFSNTDGFVFKENPCWVHGTMFGDGIYTDNFGSDYLVDSGCIGVIDIGLFMDDIPAKEFDGVIEEFTEDFEVYYSDGVFFIGDIKIKTNMEEDF